MGKPNIKQICIIGLALRLIMLAVVLVSGDSISTGLLGSTTINDDVRYLEIAETYAHSARSIIDVPSFVNTLDSIEVGYYHDAFVDLWYWIISILYYILRNESLVRITNVMFAVISIKCIYDICKSEFGVKIAKLASSLYAFLPYPIVFSCFLYKDQFYTLITLLLIRQALKCAGHIKLKDVIIMVLLVVASMLTRTGLVVLVLGALLIIIYKKGGYKVNLSTLLFFFPLAIAVLALVISLSWEPIQRKLLSYVYEFTLDSEKNTIDFFIIKSPQHIWKYPLSLSFLLFQPLRLSITNITCWMDIASILNIVSIPIAIGNILYLGDFKLKKSYLYWLAQSFYLLTIITSLGIVRHQYYLQPFMMMIYAVYYYKSKNKVILMTSSMLLIVGVMLYWFIHISI